MKSWKSFAAMMLASAIVGPLAQAATYPDKPVTLIVPYPPGGATDVVARLIAQRLSDDWKQQVVVNNKPGAGTTIAAEFVARSPGDGYTLYETTAAHTISASLYSRLNYDPIKDFAPVTLTVTIPLVLVTAPGVPAKNLQELITYAKESPNGVTVASTGNGTPQHLTAELFKEKTGAKLVHVPYKGDAPMVTDLMGGQVQMAFVTLSAALPHIKSGKLNAIALAHPRRVEAISNVPTMAEAGMPGFEAATWFGLFGPASLPNDMRQKIYKDVSRIVAQPDVTKMLQDMGGDVNNSSPEEFQKFINAEAARWGEAVKLSGARVD
ncbi:tripartite tricarboxylate transporter substrate binding protein [Bordetella sp. 02P26C-1]|uniref:tripartite tricarboxylate transporter substrate binding protein n=1 Tax=Bordetella sp. 02P26C-1 TaxID=2683195 RepID=UPI0013548381|nr:tripartite tricarboxylate transporter substrate binding protein [Bordetella sp. 02P26C-1]MVW77661.1 tripartite tricarboxylate transporter substrate binding protein [Bordetella sp. 02P26C-1]